MTLVQLRHFISLAATGSFTRSSELVHLTQPAFSRSIRALEDELGQKLFDRVGQRSELTPYGHEVLQRARALVFDAEELMASGRETGRAGVIRLGMGASPAAVLTVPLLKTMATRHPAIHVEIARGSPDRLLRALRDRALDALVLDPRTMPAAPDLKVTGLVHMRAAFMCRPDHPLTQRGGALPFAALRQYVMASTSWSEEAGRQLIEHYGPTAHLDDCITLRCDDVQSLIEVARDSDVLLLAVRAAAPDLAELPLAPALETGGSFGIVTLARRSEATALDVVRRLVEQLLHD
ncbi:LysR family transcriptional regulator [Variovorax ureilyticus]|uniref:LysR family transcriptional regulator n=1 Tax=Variovorax ureilyticus TaxID=1836198 RepID=A0ABU8VNP9_9BURK